MWAATEGNEHMVKLLIKAKASTEAKDEVKGVGMCLFVWIDEACDMYFHVCYYSIQCRTGWMPN